MRCPGQDPKYWTEDVVSDVPCPNCGRAVEFFKDEASARCPQCGHKFRNPKLDLACAQWCAYAEQCLGYAPDRLHEEGPAPSGQGGLASRLIQAVKETFEGKQDRLAHALLAFQHAKELLSKEGGDPRVVLAATLLLEVESEEIASGRGEDTGQTAETRRPSRTTQILSRMRLEEDTIRQVGAVIEALRQHCELETPEFAVACDADLLARLTARRDRFDRLPDHIERQLRTQTGRQRARDLFKTTPGGS